MASEAVNSTQITNIIANPVVVADPSASGARVRVKSASVAVAGGASYNGSTHRFFRVRSSDRILSLRVFNTDMANNDDVDFGLYSINTGAVVDADLYADGATLVTIAPAVPPTATSSDGRELRFADATTSALTDINNYVWEDLGESVDPFLTYDVVMTTNSSGTVGAGTVALTMMYTAP